MRKLLLLCNLFAITLGALAQNDTTRYTMVNGYGFTYNRIKTKGAIVLPTDTVTNKLPGCVVILNDTLYLKTAVRWEKVAASAAVIDTTVISTRAWRQKGDDSLGAMIALRVRISDTASMLLPYLGKADTLTLSLRIDQRVKYSDTAAMLAPYAKAVAGLPIGGTAGQILAKNTATNYDAGWIDNYTEDVRQTVKAAEPINKGQAVYVSGADGTNVIVSKASNTTEMTSSKTLGLMFQTLSTNGIGFVITEGRLEGINTSTATAGAPVWLGTNGNLLYGIANKPVAPAHMVYLGVVTRVNANNGEIFVHVQNGFEIEELHDVLITDSLNNQLLAYDSTTRLWKNRTIATVLGYTPVKTTDTASMLTPYVRAAGYGLTKSGQTLTVDTLNIATRAWRQKGLDSLAALEVSGSGTTNYVSKFTASGTIGNSQIFDNGTNVGIGTATPTNSKLVVSGSSASTVGAIMSTDVAGTTSFLRMLGDVGSQNLINWQSGTALRFATSNQDYGTFAERMRITSGGNVGINDNNPTDMLVVNGRMRVNGTNPIAFGNNAGGYAQIGVTGATTGNMAFSTFDGASILERMRIWANGRIGVNTQTDAGYHFDVNGSGRFQVLTSSTNFVDAAHYFYNGGGTNDIYFSTRGNGAGSGNASLINTVSGARLSFHTNGGPIRFGNTSQTAATANYLSIESNGQVGIGKTTPQTNSKLDVEGNVYVSDGSFVHFRNSIVTPGSYGIHYSGTSPRFPLRIVGNSDPVTQRFIEFGHYKNDNKDSTWNPQVLINSYNGNTGIGGQNPTYGKVQIYSSTPTQVGISLYTGLETAERTTYAANEGLQLSSYQSTNGSPNTKTSDIVANADGTVPSNMRFWTKPSGATSPNERLRITSDGDIGIGITTPSERLDVNGRARIRSIDSTASAMNVLYADATGVIKKASVTAFPGGSGTLNYIPKWTAANTLGNSQIFDNGGGVGIGTTSPGQKLEIYDGALLINRPSLANDASHTMYRTQVGTDATLGALYFTMNARPSATGTSRYVEMFAGDNVGYRNIIFPYANVGIGGSPLDKLTVINDANNTTTARVRNSDVGSSAYAMMAVNASGNSWGFRMGSTAANSNALDIVSDALGTPTSRMRIFTNGRVGINTTTDAGYIFDANGSLRNTADAALATGSGNVFVGSTTAAISNGLKYIYNEVGNASGIGPELILHNTAAADAASMAVSFTGVRSGAGVSTQIRSTRRGILTFLTQDLPSATPNTPTERMRIDALGNVGVGTQSAFGRFNVASAVGIVGINAGTSTSPERGNLYYDTDGTGWKFNIGKYQSSTFTPQMTFQDNGNIGIGVQSVEAPLHIVKTGGSTNTINVGLVVDYEATAAEAVGAGTAIQFRGKSGGGNIANYNQAQIATNNTGTNNTHGLSFYYKPNAGAQLTEGFRLHGSGAVAINTQSPTGKLHVNGDQQDALQNVVRFSANNASGQTKALDFQINAGSNLATFNTAYSGTAMALSFAMAGTEAARIHANGRVGINTGSTDAGYQLDVNGNTRVTGKIDVTANASIGHNIIRSGTSDIAAQIFNSNGWFLSGAEGANGGAIFTGSTPYAAVAGSGYNRPLQLATNNTVRMEIDSTGLVGINTTSPTERLDVNGRARIRTVDSTATATNMLYVDNNGVIKKTAVPGTSVTYSTDVASIASGSGFTFVKDSATGTNHHFLNKIEDVNTGDATVTMQIAVYKTTSTFTTGAWQSVATIPGLYAPQTTVIYELPGYASGTTYYTSGSAQFSGAAEYTGTKVVRIDPSGNVEVRIGTVSASATQGGTNYVIIPIAVTWVVNPTPL